MCGGRARGRPGLGPRGGRNDPDASIALVPFDLLLVRHAMPAFGPDQPSDQWELSAEGHAAAAGLARRLPPGAHLVASEEPKAWQTLTPAGAVIRDARFNEVRRKGEPYDGNFRELRQSYVDGVDHPGWEQRAQVAARFESGVADHLAVAGTAPMVIASHGMAMTIWLTARIGLADPGAFWAELRLPDLLEVDLTARTSRRSVVY
jgi:broad specificity phosphatase PhoE